MIDFFIQGSMQIKDLSFMKYFPNLRTTNISQTSYDSTYLSDWVNMPTVTALLIDDKYDTTHKAIFSGIRFRKSALKLIKVGLTNKNEG
jgi:hypothetical protein